MKKNITMKTGWSQITLDEFIQIDNLRKSNKPADEISIEMISILTGWKTKEIEQLPLSVVTRLINGLDFLSTPIKGSKTKKNYIFNNRKYKLDCDITDISTAKYIDYTNIMQNEDKDYLSLIALCLVPKGHNYNDGYDMEQAREDLKTITMEDYQGIVNFLLKQSVASMLVLEDCFKSQNQNQTNPESIELAKCLHNMAYSLWSVRFAK